MDNIRCNRVILALGVIFSCFQLQLFAQDLPKMDVDKTIRMGELPNGIRYYLVPNSSVKGFADFRLVQKGYTDYHGSSENILRLSSFGEASPVRFLESKGITPGPDGYFKEENSSTIFTFRDVPTFDKNAADSTLLLLFDLIRETPASQAVMISGDIAAEKLADRMYVLSMTIPRLPSTEIKDIYKWNQNENHVSMEQVASAKDVVTTRLSCAMKRTDAPLRGTVLPLVSERFASQFSDIACRRIEYKLKEANIPFTGLEGRYLSSDTQPGDESVGFTVTSWAKDSERVGEIVSRVVSDLGANGAGLEEYSLSKDRFVLNVKSESSYLSNAEYLDRCTGAYIYGAHLTSPSIRRKFLTATKTLNPAKELELFNNYLKAAIGAKESTDSLAFSYAKGDTLSLAQPKLKVKLKSTVPDPITGGSVWTFSNGFRVVFKKTQTKGQFSYGFMVGGGFYSVPDLKAGESAFVSDMMGLYGVSGMSPVQFKSMLEEHEIVFNPSANISDLRITGSAPSPKFHLLLKTLISYTRDRKLSSEAFGEFIEREKLRESYLGYSLKNTADSLLSPSYKYLEARNWRNIGPDFQTRVETYLEDHLGKPSDCVLVLVGDLDETYVLRTLTKSLGEMVPSKNGSVRSRISHEYPDRWITYRRSSFSGEEQVLTAISMRKPFSMNSYLSFRIAAIEFEKALGKRLSPLGVYAEVEPAVEMYPADRYTMYVTLRWCDGGLPSGNRRHDIRLALDAVRKTQNELSSLQLDAATLKGYKESLKADLARDYSSGANLVDAVLRRYSLGRDLVSGYQGQVDAVSLGNVNDILVQLEKGSRVEVISR